MAMTKQGVRNLNDKPYNGHRSRVLESATCPHMSHDYVPVGVGYDSMGYEYDVMGYKCRQCGAINQRH